MLNYQRVEHISLNMMLDAGILLTVWFDGDGQIWKKQPGVRTTEGSGHCSGQVG
jgi:hypothetical protein